MGYLNYNLEKVASTITDGMEKKASRLLSVLGKVGRGIKSAPGHVLNHVARHPGKYALGAGLAGLAGWGSYNYANTGKIDPETGQPVLARDRALVAGDHNFQPEAPERRAYANALEDYKNKRGYYKNMPWWQKALPFLIADPKRIQLEFYRHSGKYAPRKQPEDAPGIWSGSLNRYDAPFNGYAENAIDDMSPEEQLALFDPKVYWAVQSSLYGQGDSTPADSPFRDPLGYNGLHDSEFPRRYYGKK